MAARFLREARVTGQLEHPNIMPVYELGQRADGTFYYTMKLVRGRTLADALAECASLSDRLDLLSHYVDLCNAIAYAHSRGVIHRDIKTDNVMLGEFGETVVLDWGLAKVAGREDIRVGELERGLQLMRDEGGGKTMDGSAIGTPAYMPPEQAEGAIDEIDERSDVWSLGAVLYEVLTSKPPFEGVFAYEIVGKVLKDEVVPPRAKDESIPAELSAVADAYSAYHQASLDAAARLRAVLDHGSPAVAVAFSPNAEALASAGEGGGIQIWNAATGRPLREIDFEEKSSRALGFSPNGKLLAAGGDSGTVRLFDTADWARDERHAWHQTAVADLAFSPQSSLLASASRLGQTVIWDVESRELVEVAPAPKYPFVAFSADGTRLAAASAGGVLLWDVAEGQPVRTVGLGHDIGIDAALSADGRWLAVAGHGMAVHLCDLESSEQPCRTLEGHTESVLRV